MSRALLIGGLSFGVVALLLASSSAQAATSTGVRPMSDRERAVVRHVLQAESGGKYTAINANADGAGISVGLLQWSQQGGGLAELLEAWTAAHPGLVEHYLGASHAQVLAVARRRSLDPVDGSVLWSSTWLPRWRAALADRHLQAVQEMVVVNGSHMRGAISAARTLNTSSSRALALLFDRAVQQGPDRVRRAAQTVAARMPATATELERLRAVADELVERFARSTDPGPQPAGRLQWRLAGPGVWHLYSGDFDLYRTARGRADAILNDPALGPNA